MKSTSAFSLVEVTLALGIASCCLVVLVGLLPVGLHSNRVSFEETEALNVASGLIADLQSVPRGLTSTGQRWVVDQLEIPEVGDAASTQTIYQMEQFSNAAQRFSTSLQSGARYRVVVKMTPPAKIGGAGQKTATMAQVTVSWPAVADNTTRSQSAGSVQTFTALERN
jgi:uncharacterized protein (TIGR02598 family)